VKLSLVTARGTHLAASLLALLACTAALVAGCGDDEGDPVTELPGGGEGGTLPPPVGTDGAASGPDAGAVDAADAGPPRTCSNDEFCHTTVPVGQTLLGVWADGAGAAWAVSAQGAILRWDGTAWSVHAKTKGALHAVWGSGPNDVWVGGAAGVLHGTGATSSSLVFADTVAPGHGGAAIVSIWGTGAGDVWAAGSTFDGGYVARVLHYGASGGDAGATWSIDGVSGQPVAVTRVWGTPASGVWIAGVRNNPITIAPEVVVLRRAPSATKFSEVPIPGDPGAPKGVGQIDKLFDAAATADGTMWVLGRTNTSKPGYARGVSADGGLTFTWTFGAHGPSVGPLSSFVRGASSTDAWIGGEYGRLHHWDGAAWTQARTTVSKYPLTTTLHAMWSQGQELWVVGDGIALHRAPGKKN